MTKGTFSSRSSVLFVKPVYLKSSVRVYDTSMQVVGRRQQSESIEAALDME